jgi:hypothetical protein
MYLTANLHSLLWIIIVLAIVGFFVGYSPYGQTWPRYAPNGLGGLVVLILILLLLHVI